jgi:rRNA maturation RNase YbeY
MQQVKPLTPRCDWTALTVVLVDDEGMIPVQRACFGKGETTDVISLAYEPAPPQDPGHTAELVLNVERAWAERRRGSASGELALYLAHGCNHLAGGEDDTPARRSAMQQRERAWLQEARRRDLIGGLIPQEETQTVS